MKVRGMAGRRSEGTGVREAAFIKNMCMGIFYQINGKESLRWKRCCSALCEQ